NARKSQDRKRADRDSHRELRDDEEMTAIDNVRQCSRGQPKHEEGKAFGREEQGHYERRRGERRHLPALTHIGHVGADVRRGRGNPKGPKRLISQRAPRRSRLAHYACSPAGVPFSVISDSFESWLSLPLSLRAQQRLHGP